MLGLKMNPKRIFGMLQNFGLDINTMLPQVEKLLIDYAASLEKEAGSTLVGVLNLNADKTALDFAFYKQDSENKASLQLWKSFPFSQLIQKIQNIQSDDTEFILAPADHSGDTSTTTTVTTTTTTDAGSTSDGSTPAEL